MEGEIWVSGGEEEHPLFLYLLLGKILFPCSFAYKYSYEDMHKFTPSLGKVKNMRQRKQRKLESWISLTFPTYICRAGMESKSIFLRTVRLLHAVAAQLYDTRS
jgi:hypothetical protein